MLVDNVPSHMYVLFDPLSPLSVYIIFELNEIILKPLFRALVSLLMDI